MIFSVPRSWEGQTCVILAGGPSLKNENLALLDAYHPRVIAINDSWKLRPYASVLYFCDLEWWQGQMEKNQPALDGSVRFRDMLYKDSWVKGGEPLKNHPEVKHIPFTGQIG